MCGLAGIYSSDRPPAREVLLAMAGELSHRGPDGVGLYLDGRFGMVNTRLSIVDVAHGEQPLPDESGRFWAMQNGEIYNYVELREELGQLGHRFRTHSDTEVLAHAFSRWGPGCLERLNGDFAVAIWDEEQRELFLARDRFGVRPLYVAELPDGDLVFASEIKAILRSPKLERRLDPVALVDCFVSWSTLPDRSAFAGIRELAPGCYLRARCDGSRIERTWWRVRFRDDEQQQLRPERELAGELRDLLADACRLRLRADVPVGVYLSGGLDSSLIAALARQQTPDALRTFSLGFSDSRFDERAFQDRMTSWLGVSSDRVDVSQDDIGRSFPRVVTLCERPLLRTSPGPLLTLSAMVRRSGLKVVLTGEGADELFGGYDIFKEAMVRRFWARQPHSRIRPLLFRRLYPFLGTEFKRAGPFLHRYFGIGLEQTGDPLYSHAIRFAAGERLLRFLNPDLLATVARDDNFRGRLIARLPAEFFKSTPLCRAQYLEMETFLFGYLLHAQGDRMMMGHSVEGRFPYLDHRVAEFACGLPDRMKLRGLREKHLLRLTARPLLPAEIVDRVKHPYRAPILRSFFGEARLPYVDELLDPAYVASTGLFQADAVRSLVEKCRLRAGTGVGESDEMALVGILSTLLLHDRMVRRPQLAAPLIPQRVIVSRAAAAADYTAMKTT